MTTTDLKRWQRVVLWPRLRFVLPTLTALYLNHHYLRGEMKTTTLPAEPWAQEAANGLMARSEDRLRGLEAKAPGLAAIAAIIAAGVVAAIVAAGGHATLFGKVLLGIAAWYAIWSLVVPIYMVGPQARDTIDLNHVIAAADTDSPEQYLAVHAQKAAQANVRRAHRIGNLQDAARNECGAALAVLSLWLVLGPALGLLVHDASGRQGSRPPAPSTTKAPPATTGTVPRARQAQRPARRRPPGQPNTGGARAPGGSG